VPAGHIVQLSEPSNEKEPGKQFIQALISTEFVNAFAVPFGHGGHVICPVKLLNVPAKQGKHILFKSRSYVPKVQGRHIAAPLFE
jgi:hypothetical protein